MSELKFIGRHAGTVLAGQLAVMAFGVTDTIVAGRYSDSALAALSIGSAVYISVFVALMGVLQALLPVWAELHGARRQEELGRSVRQALYLCGLTILVGTVALLSPAPLLRWTGVPPAMQGEVEQYLAVLAAALPPALLFRMYSTLNQSLSKPFLVTWLQLGSLLVKVPLTLWFAFGGFGLDAHGAVGCAWATLVVNYLMLAVAVVMLRTQPLYRPYGIWQRIERPQWHALAEFARLGVPAGLAIMVEVTSFTLMALFIARMGTVASAGHQIASNITAVMYMVPLSIAIATSARASYWLGAGDGLRARHAIHTGFKLTVLMALALSAILLLARDGLAGIYASNPAVKALAASLLAWVAFYHLADAVQALCVFVLRCYRVTVSLLVVYCVLLWGLGLGGGFLLAYEVDGLFAPIASPAAFWMTSAGALALTAAIFLAILWRILKAQEPSPLGGQQPA
ncbi:MAG TPA: MATE family efflux transporter [Burkholderiaceae bacterium]|nr:MATE family efflux transporter [Burkholderiaceae bacterium]